MNDQNGCETASYCISDLANTWALIGALSDSHLSALEKKWSLSKQPESSSM
jgi:hypothetical protein